MRSAAIVAIMLLSSCAAEPTETGSTSSPVAAEKVRCIDATRVAGRRAESDRALVFELSDGRAYRNDLPDACPGIARASNFGTLAIDPIKTRMCRGDAIRIYDPADLPVGGIKAVRRCRLGDFTRVAGR